MSKVTPLPTSVTLGASARPQVKSTRRGACAGGAADRVNERQVAREQIVAARDLGLGAEALGQPQRLLLQRLRAKIVGRRIDEIAPEGDRPRDALDPRAVDAVGRDEARLRARSRAIAREAVEAEQEAERGEARIMRRIGEAIDAGRQKGRELAGQQRIAIARRRRLQGRTARRRARPCAIGQDLAAARRGLETGGFGESRGRARRAPRGSRPNSPCVTNQIGMASAVGAANVGDKRLAPGWRATSEGSRARRKA